MEKQDIEKDLKTLDMHEPSAGFASRVTIQAMQQLETEPASHPWMKWIPRLCAAGFGAVFLVFLFLMIRYFDMEMIHSNVFLALQAIGFVAVGYFLYLVMDQALRRIIVR